MRLTRYTDYAMRVLLYLGRQPDRLCSIAEIAQAYAISQNHLMKIVNDLVNAGYLESVRGRNGGIRLARAAEKINVGALIRHTEDDFDLVECDSCLIAPACGLTSVLGVLIHVCHDQAGMQRPRIRKRHAGDNAQRPRIPIGGAQAQGAPDLGDQRQWSVRRPVGRSLLYPPPIGGQEGKPQRQIAPLHGTCVGHDSTPAASQGHRDLNADAARSHRKSALPARCSARRAKAQRPLASGSAPRWAQA